MGPFLARDVEGIAYQIMREHKELPQEYLETWLRTTVGGIIRFGIRSKEGLEDYMLRLYQGFREQYLSNEGRRARREDETGIDFDLRDVVESGVKGVRVQGSRQRADRDKINIWRYLGENTQILDISRSELYREHKHVYNRLLRDRLLDMIYPCHNGRRG